MTGNISGVWEWALSPVSLALPNAAKPHHRGQCAGPCAWWKRRRVQWRPEGSPQAGKEPLRTHGIPLSSIMKMSVCVWQGGIRTKGGWRWRIGWWGEWGCFRKKAKVEASPLEEGTAAHLVFLPGEFHGQRSLAGYSSWGHKQLDMTERLSTHTEVFALLLERTVTSKETHFWKDTKFTVFPVEGGGEGPMLLQ